MDNYEIIKRKKKRQDVKRSFLGGMRIDY